MIIFLAIVEDYCEIMHSAMNMSDTEYRILRDESIIHAKHCSNKFTFILALLIPVVRDLVIAIIVILICCRIFFHA